MSVAMGTVGLVLLPHSSEERIAEQLAKERENEFADGPLSVLMNAVKLNEQVVINVRNNHKLVAQVKAFDRHCNMCV